MNTVTFIILANIIGFITCPGETDPKPPVAGDSPEHVPPSPPAQAPLHPETSEGHSHDPSSLPHDHQTVDSTQPPNHHAPDHASNANHTPPPPATLLSETQVGKNIVNAVDDMYIALKKIGDKLSTAFKNSPYNEHVEKIAKATTGIVRELGDSASLQLQRLRSDPNKPASTNNVDHTDHTAKLLTEVDNLFGAIKGIGDTYANNNFPNTISAIPKVQQAKTDDEAKKTLAKAIASDTKILTQHLPNLADVIPAVQGKVKSLISDDKRNSNNSLQRSGSVDHGSSSEQQHRSEHGTHDEKGSEQMHKPAQQNESTVHSDAGHSADQEKAKQQDEDESSQNVVQKIFGMVLSILPVHSIMRILWKKNN